MQPDGGNLWYFKLRLFDLTELIFESLRLGCKDIGFRKSKFVARIQFLCDNSLDICRYNCPVEIEISLIAF